MLGLHSADPLVVPYKRPWHRQIRPEESWHLNHTVGPSNTVYGGIRAPDSESSTIISPARPRPQPTMIGALQTTLYIQQTLQGQFQRTLLPIAVIHMLTPSVIISMMTLRSLASRLISSAPLGLPPTARRILEHKSPRHRQGCVLLLTTTCRVASPRLSHIESTIGVGRKRQRRAHGYSLRKAKIGSSLWPRQTTNRSRSECSGNVVGLRGTSSKTQTRDEDPM